MQFIGLELKNRFWIEEGRVGDEQIFASGAPTVRSWARMVRLPRGLVGPPEVQSCAVAL